MPADANIFQQYLQQPKSVLDYQNQYADADAKRNANAIQALTLQQQTASTAQSLAERNALQRIAATSGGDRQALISGLRNSGLPGLMTQADSLEQSGAKLLESQATAAEKNATAGKTTQETQIAGHAQHLQALSTVNDPQAAVQWITDGVRSGALPAAGLQQALDRLQQSSATPEGFAQWKQQTQAMGLTVQQQMEQTTAKPTEVRLGNVVKTIDMNPRSQTFGKEVVAPQAIGLSPDTASTNATHIQGINIQQAGENSRSRATIAKDYNVAGLNPDGTPSGNVDAMIDMLGQNRLNPTLALGRMSGPQRANLVAQVQAKYPGWDETTYDAKKGAAQKFTYGAQGDQLRSNATASAHLDQLEQLATALNNGNVRLINQIANAYGIQSGAAPAQVFDAVKGIVGQEVVKSIVAGGGGEGERNAAGAAFDKNSSPQQFLQTKAAVKHIMKAQADNLMAQRRAAGLSDSTLPKYGEQDAGGAPATPPGWGIQRVK